MKVYAAPDDTTLGLKIRNALEAIAADEYSGPTALVAPGPLAVRYITLVCLGAERGEAYGRECQSAVASGASASALSIAQASVRALRRAGLKVETRDGVLLTVKHDRCHSQIYRALESAQALESAKARAPLATALWHSLPYASLRSSAPR